eukprot:693637-Amphidinium_carterae.1
MHLHVGRQVKSLQVVCSELIELGIKRGAGALIDQCCLEWPSREACEVCVSDALAPYIVAKRLLSPQTAINFKCKIRRGLRGYIGSADSFQVVGVQGERLQVDFGGGKESKALRLGRLLDSAMHGSRDAGICGQSCVLIVHW